MELVERIERATLAAVSPQHVQELPGWLLPMDPGTVGRAYSAVPITHKRPELDVLDTVTQRYVWGGWPPVVRLPDLVQWQCAQAKLVANGWRRGKSVCVMTARVATLCDRTGAALPQGARMTLEDHASSQWIGMFLGEGFDPVDGASRSQALARSKATRFAGVVIGADMVACGAASYCFGLFSAHGLRTAMGYRGRGLATFMLGGMAREAQRQGIADAFLQVESDNPARALYERLGFSLAWQYQYWKPA
jgi:ribosomal protein S18 acetylase RimI-like enzyme